MKDRFDFTDLLVRASTWLALLSAAATAALGAYAVMPSRVQDAFPEHLLAILGGTAMLAAFLIPVATSFKQRGLGRMNQVQIQTTTTVKGDVEPAEATRIAEAVASAEGGNAAAP